MPYQKIGLNEFFKRFLNESVKDNRPNRKFVWVVGAGMSVTSGIPIAKDVSDRIVLLEYFNNLNTGLPWIDTDIENGILFNPKLEFEVYNSTYEGLYQESSLQTYFDWYEMQVAQDTLNEQLNLAYQWLSTLQEFKDITPDNPECYQLLFRHFILSKDTATAFLSSLIRRAKSVNLCHLALAGILRDFPEWGDSVYTTNFDDLLLKSLLLLNKSARVFGEYDTKIGPSLNPNYPQIIHLHGKYTGYSIKNTTGEISNRKSVLQESFKNHISDSNIIILGYSGWDDVIMETLQEWNNKPELIRGNLYWVPFRDESTMLPAVRKWLSSLLHTNKAFVIVKDSVLDGEKFNNGLDADEFMLNMCNFINRMNGGFSPYRQEIVSNAYHQHKFVLNELKKFPNFSPSRLFDIVDRAEQSIDQGNITKFNGYLDYATEIADANDLPNRLKCKAYIRMGNALIASKQPKKAIRYFTIADGVARIEDKEIPEAKLDRIECLLKLANIHLNMGYNENTNKYIRQARIRSESIKKEYPDLHNRVIYVFGHMMLLEEHMKNNYVDDFENEISPSDNTPLWKIKFSLLQCMKALSKKSEIGIDSILQTNINYLIKNDLDTVELANHFLLLAMYYITIDKFELAQNNIDLAKNIYTEKNMDVGVGNCINVEGWKLYSMRDKPSALQFFLKSADIFEVEHNYYNFGNALTDAFNIAEEISSETQVQILSRLQTIPNSCLSKRTRHLLAKQKHINDEQE